MATVGRAVLAHAAAVGVALAATAAGCRRGREPAAAPPPVEVTAYTVEPREASVVHEFVGQVAATRQVTLLARVTGQLQEQRFKDGARVHAGDVLLLIDPRPYRAALARAEAQLAKARSELAKAELDVARYEPLVRDRAVPRQTLDDALAARRSATATVKAQQAAVQSARLDVAYTTITSPVDGRIGRTQVYPGQLVTAGQTQLATVSTIDPIQVDFSVSEIEYLRIAALLRDPSHTPPPVELVLADGSRYPSRASTSSSARSRRRRAPSGSAPSSRTPTSCSGRGCSRACRSSRRSGTCSSSRRAPSSRCSRRTP